MTKQAAIVLAASQGLGFAAASSLARRGMSVLMCGRDEGRLEKAVTAIQSAGGDAEGSSLDVTDPDAVRSFVAGAESEYEIRALVSNVGGPPAGSFRDLTLDHWDAAYSTVLRPALVAIGAALPGMVDRRYGRVVVVGSSNVVRPIPGLSLSNVFRPAVFGLVSDVAVSVAAHGVTVNMVAPGRIDTERVRDLDRRVAEREGISIEAVMGRSVSRIPAGRYGMPSEFGEAVAFLASEEASYITGQVLMVDGGLTKS